MGFGIVQFVDGAFIMEPTLPGASSRNCTLHTTDATVGIEPEWEFNGGHHCLIV